MNMRDIYVTSVPLYSVNLQPISSQVSFICVCGRHFLLLCWDDLRCSRHPGTLQQNNVAVLHSSSGELYLLLASAFSRHPLSQTPAPQVTRHSRLFVISIHSSFMLIMYSQCRPFVPFIFLPMKGWIQTQANWGWATLNSKERTSLN